MSAFTMPGGTWRALIAKKKRERTVYRITIVVRGREIVKEYRNEALWRQWQRTFRAQIEQGKGVERMWAEKVCL